MLRREVVAALVFTIAGVAGESAAQYQVSLPDGKGSLRFGAFTQFQGEWTDTGSGDTSQNLFLRRARFMMGGKLGEKVTFFFETDSPNLGKAAADGTKNEGSMYVQDLILTYAFTPTWKVDGGLLLLPLAYHSGQGATSLLAIDYSPYAFVASAPTRSRLGRDYGVQARAYPLGGHVELRAAAFQGIRDAGSSNPLRLFGRAVWYPLEAQSDFFYTGTTFGKRKLLGLGVSYDRQKDYSTLGADVFLDHPIGATTALTLQGNYWRIDGGALITDLRRQDLWSAEVGLFIAPLKVTPYVQAGQRRFVDGVQPDETSYQAGLAWWIDGHKLNVKAGVSHIEKEGTPDRTQIVAQAQLLLW